MPLTSGNDYQGPLYAPHPKMTEPKPEYGTAEFYQALFADILADCGTGLDTDTDTATNMLRGFELAIIDWMTYHEKCIKSYRDLHAQFLGINAPEPYNWPDFPELKKVPDEVQLINKEEI